jgi:Ca2+/Na+ antiporter
MGAINSLGDFFSITAVAKVGLPVMAVAGVLGGQNFNQLAGLGTALLMSCLFNGGEV